MEEHYLTQETVSIGFQFRYFSFHLIICFSILGFLIPKLFQKILIIATPFCVHILWVSVMSSSLNSPNKYQRYSSQPKKTVPTEVAAYFRKTAGPRIGAGKSAHLKVTTKDNMTYIQSSRLRVPTCFLPYLECPDLNEELAPVCIENTDKKTFMQRYFSKMEEGSLRSSIFNLMSCALGAGMLSLPFVLRVSGYALGSFLIILGGLVSFFGMIWLMKAHSLTNAATFSELIEITMGKFWSKFLLIICIFQAYGISVSYFVIMTTDICQVLKALFFSKDQIDNFYVWVSIILLSLIPLTPLVCKRTLAELRYFNFLGVTAAIYPAILCCFLAPFYFYNSYYPKDYTAVKINLNILTGFSVTLFAFTCQHIVIPTRIELKNPTEYRCVKVIFKRHFSNVSSCGCFPLERADICKVHTLGSHCLFDWLSHGLHDCWQQHAPADDRNQASLSKLASI